MLMLSLPLPRLLAGLFTLAVVTSGRAGPVTIQLATPPPPLAEGFHLGAPRAPDGSTLTLDSRSLLLNGRRWTPVMGEFHYARYPVAEWRGELLKMKAGGIDIVATYVFWIHHEEIEGQWNWAGDRSLRQFVTSAREVGLKVIVRCGPWCHGEVRNGGLPDWILARGAVRSDNPAYLDSVTRLYGQIAAQLTGLLWKDGGPVIGIQLDNEYNGPAAHLLTLKRLAREAGLDVPLYTRTGWPALQTPIPFGEIVPLYGVYAEGFWDRELTRMPGTYWAGFHFSTLRNDANIASEALGRHEVKDDPDVARYPYLTCEIGGGMMSSYHRRILVDPRDVEATTLVKLGSGSNSPGYYMYHGGANPEGQLTTLMEEQATPLTNWNDMPVKNYDFQAPLGQYGQVRPQYYLLRRLHSFLHSFGAQLADMGTFLPDQRPNGKDDHTTLRWSARSDGTGGFVFVNNYERLNPLPAKPGVQFSLRLAAGGTLTFPSSPVTVPAEARFIWPFNLDLGGVTLAWATAQPVQIEDRDGLRTVTFAETPGIAPRFCFGADVSIAVAPVESGSAGNVFELPAGSRTYLGHGNRTLCLVVLSEADSLAPGAAVAANSRPVISIRFELIHPAGPARQISLGKISQPVAAAPTESDFVPAAVWSIKLPTRIDLSTNPLLRLYYTGDVARVTIGGRLITDDFYNGAPIEIGLRRHAAELATGELRLAILPLRKDAPIYFSSPAARPDFGERDAVAELIRAEMVR
jgi:beta-galactosidase